MVVLDRRNDAIIWLHCRSARVCHAHHPSPVDLLREALQDERRNDFAGHFAWPDHQVQHHGADGAHCATVAPILWSLPGNDTGGEEDKGHLNLSSPWQ